MTPDYRECQKSLERREARWAFAFVAYGIPLGWLILAVLVAEDGIGSLDVRALLFFVLFPFVMLGLGVHWVVNQLRAKPPSQPPSDTPPTD